MSADLSLVPTDDLLDALKARFDHIVFSGLRVGGKERNDAEHRLWHGHAGQCVWLASGLIHDIHVWERHPDDGDGDAREAPEPRSGEA